MSTQKSIAERSLSTKLLFLTIIFVLFAEIVVMIPLIANQRFDWFKARLEAAYLVALALEGPRDSIIEEDVARQLFSTANILGVTVNRDDMRMLILAPEIDPHGPPRMHRVSLSEEAPPMLAVDALSTLFSSGNDLIQVTGAPRFAAEQEVDIIVSQQALRRDLYNYARNIFALSMIISTLTGALLYWAMNRIIVRPVKKLTKSMSAFEADPDQASRIHVPSARNDEIGAAERSLTAMQRSIHDLLNERRRLAALGAGISKISHDLRNILASAQLMSDRLSKSADPGVRKLSPRLISALDRAITLSRDTLAFGGMEPRKLNKTKFDLHALAEEVFEDTAAMFVSTNNLVEEPFFLYGDRTQLYRSLFNLVRNSVDAIGSRINGAEESSAIAGAVSITASKDGDDAIIHIIDTGPGISEHARQTLFEPFKGSQKPGGSGLGVAIASEIVRAHGGVLDLVISSQDGVKFRLALPDAVRTHVEPSAAT